MVNYSTSMELVLTTESNMEKAESLAKALLERRVVACVSIQKVESHYCWEGGFEHVSEAQLLIKTTQNQLINLRKAFKELHSYDVPEFIHWSTSAGEDYKNWIDQVIPLS